MILAIDTSCDETSVAVTDKRRIITSVVYSQMDMHATWGGVVPSLAKKAHLEKIDKVIEKALKNVRVAIHNLKAIAVTQGPGLAIALEVGIAKAKELAQAHSLPLIAVNHMEGHIYSSFAQNRNGRPQREFAFPMLALLVSGGHTQLVMVKDHITYEIVGETVDDACGEALDKAARMLGFGYPGGPILEKLAREAGNTDVYHFPRPMASSKDLNFSFSGLKTAFLHKTRQLGQEEVEKHLRELASSFQEAAFASVIGKLKKALELYRPRSVCLGGGVVVNGRLRTLVKGVVGKTAPVYYPPYKYLNFDNAAMIGIAAHYHAARGNFVKDIHALERVPRLSLA